MSGGIRVQRRPKEYHGRHRRATDATSQRADGINTTFVRRSIRLPVLRNLQR